jgi:hypothetical protein
MIPSYINGLVRIKTRTGKIQLTRDNSTSHSICWYPPGRSKDLVLTCRNAKA